MNKRLTVSAAVLFALSISDAYAVTYTVNPSHNAGGTIDPSVKTEVEAGSSLTFTATADNSHYVTDIRLDGKTVVDFAKGHEASYTISTIDRKHKIAARFAPNPVIVARSNNGGSVEPSGVVPVDYDGSQSFTITPSTGFHLDSVKADGKPVEFVPGDASTVDFDNVVARHALMAKFVINSYDITTSPGSNGSILPATGKVKHGAKKVFTIVPTKGYRIASLTVNGDEQTGLPSSGKYTLTLNSVTEDLDIAATFEQIVISGLQIGSQVSVVDAQPAAANAMPVTGQFQPQALTANNTPQLDPPPADSDYFKDKTHVYVHEKAGDAFKTVNQILCMLQQTQYSDSSLLNQGFYKAMVNKASCEGNDSADNSSASMQGGTSSSSSAPSYDTWTVKSDRTSDTGSQTLTAYVHTNGGPGDMPMIIQAKMTITEAASEANPLGLFSMNFLGTLADPQFNGMPIMRGVLKTVLSDGKVVIKFAEQQGPDQSPMHVAKAAFIKNDVAETGQGSALQQDMGQPSEQINFAYNANYFLRSNADNSESRCLNRNSFESSAWRYGMYDAVTGDRANLLGGFPINTQADGHGAYGYLGYHGLNLPPNVQGIGDGSTVYRMNFGEGAPPTATPYTLAVKGGKLKKHVRNSVTLDDIKNIPLEGNLPTPGNSTPGNGMVRVIWDGTNLAVVAEAQMSPNGPPAWQDLPSPTVIDNSSTLAYSILGLYSQALGGQVNIELAECAPVDNLNPIGGVQCATPSGTTPVVFYKESVVTPNDVSTPSTLACFDNCPKTSSPSGLSGMGWQDLIYTKSFDPAVSNRHDYSFTDLTLMDGENPVVLASAPQDQPWGFNSGPLFEATQDNLGALACDWDANQTCGWKAWNTLPEFYTWETGPNAWNRYTAVLDDTDQFVTFEEPWQVSYTYPLLGTGGVNSADTDVRYGGSLFFLQYEGFGELHGIPGKCIDPSTNLPVNDCSGPGFRWVPEFTIPEGAMARANDSDYLVKPLEMEQRMAPAKGNECNSLSAVDMHASWPSLKSDWVNPNLPEEPKLDTPPKVVGGVIQTNQ